MADLSHATDGPSPLSPEGYDESLLPDYEVEFLSVEDIQAFASALSAPDPSPSPGGDDGGSTFGLTSRNSVVDVGNGFEGGGSGMGSARESRKGSTAGLWHRSGSSSGILVGAGQQQDGGSVQSPKGVGGARESKESLFITAQNDWAPVGPTKRAGSIHSISGAGAKTRSSSSSRPTEGNAGGIGNANTSGRRTRKKDRKRKQRRSSDETREGYLYTILAWPLLAVVGAWIAGLGISYLSTRLYIWLYEHFVAWRGKRNRLRVKLHATDNYADWVKEARALDGYLGNESWKEVDEYAYYDHKTVRRVMDQLKKFRRKVEAAGGGGGGGGEEGDKVKAVEDLKALVEACVKNNFVGVENSRLYSQTYYGTKNLVQEFVDEGLFSSFFAMIVLVRRLLKGNLG